jgi:KUP system potassium uptake protein
MFAPIILIWLFFTSSIGIYNIFRWNPGIYKGLSPYYIFSFFHQTGKKGWISLGGVVLCITGKQLLLDNLKDKYVAAIIDIKVRAASRTLMLLYQGQVGVHGSIYFAIV